MTPEQIATVREYHGLQPMSDYIRCIDTQPEWSRDGAILTIGRKGGHLYGYEPSTYETANARAILEDLQNLDPGGTYVARNVPHVVQVDLAKAPDPVLEYLDNTGHALTNYPVLDDDLQLQIENERNQKDWDDDLCQDVMREIAHALEYYTCDQTGHPDTDAAEEIAQTYTPTLADLANLGVEYYREETQAGDHGLYLDTEEAAEAIINHRTHGKMLALHLDGTATVRYQDADKAPRHATRYADGTAAVHCNDYNTAVREWYQCQQ